MLWQDIPGLRRASTPFAFFRYALRTSGIAVQKVARRSPRLTKTWGDVTLYFHYVYVVHLCGHRFTAPGRTQHSPPER